MVSTYAHSFNDTLRIKLVTCTSDGFYNSLKEKVDSKKFWITQNVIFQNAIDSFGDESITRFVRIKKIEGNV